MSPPIPQKIATVRLLDEVNAIVSGLRIEDLNALYEQYGMFAKNHFFDPRFKLQRWDGKIRFFSKGGKTYVQLLPEIVESLNDWGYKIKLVDDRFPFDLNIDPIDENYFAEYGWTLGSHQVKAANSIFEEHNGIIRVGTGGGKTLITGVLCHSYLKKGIRLIVIVPNEDLVLQTAQEINAFGFSVGVYYGRKKETDKDVIVSTWQSLNVNPKILSLFGGIIVDECHGANTTTKLAGLLGKEGRNHPVRIGLTGTLPDYHTDKMTVLCHLGPVRAVVSSSELIEKGWLSQLNLVMYHFTEEFKSEHREYIDSLDKEHENKNITYTQFKNKVLFPVFDAEKKYLNGNVDRLEVIVEFIKRVTQQNGNTFILVNTIAMGTKLAKMLGDNAIYISSKNKNRKDIYDLFETSNELIGIATLSLASTGLNIPRIFNLITIDQSKAYIRVVQTIGRGLRKASDKDTVNVFDMFSDTKYAKKHMTQRKKIFKKEKYPFRICKVDYKSPNAVDLMVKAANKTKQEKLAEEVFK